MQLSPLQSRLAASVIASCLLILLYFTLFVPQFADAAELKVTLPIILDDIDLSSELDARGPLDPTYEPEFAAFDRSIMGRAPAGVNALTNNIPMPMNVVAGTTQLFVFTQASVSERESVDVLSELELREVSVGPQEQAADVEERSDDSELVMGPSEEKRQSAKTVFISANTCVQPQALNSSTTTADAPQLTLFVSTSTSNTSPGPAASSASQVSIPFTEGAVMFNLSTATDVYLGVYAPNVSSTTFSSTTYNFQVAVSVDAWYHSYNVEQDADLIWVDSDYQGALLMTHNLTSSTDASVEAQIMVSQPYVMFAQNQNDSSINGLRYSYCGLQNYAQIAATKNGRYTNMVTTGMTQRGQGNLPKQEFYFSGLNSSSSYLGILASNGNSSSGLATRAGEVGGGGHVFRATNFTTKSGNGNCQLIRNLTFCNEVAYAVPSNPNFGDEDALAKFYDDMASSMYAFFTKAMAQVACEAPSTQQYSLVRNCTDCAAAYKSWLCSVTIPRCEDFSNDASYLQPRAINQTFPSGEKLDQAVIAGFPTNAAFTSSRNPMIDEVIKPGPYKEVLPCDYLCYDLVQSCPASMGFGCPTPGMIAFNTSYGQKSDLDSSGVITCNYQGAAHVFSASNRLAISWTALSVVFVAVASLLI